MFLYFIHLLDLFYIKLFSQSETIFTNDEPTIFRRLSFIFDLFDIFEKYVLNNEYKNLNHKFLVLRHRIFKVDQMYAHHFRNDAPLIFW